MWTREDDYVETLLLELNVGKCDGPCQEENVPRVHCDSRRMDSDATYELCVYCAEEHHQYWDDMWAHYYGSRF